MSTFLGSLWAAGIAVQQGLSVVDRSARVFSEVTPSVASQSGLSARSLSQGGGFARLGP